MDLGTALSLGSAAMGLFGGNSAANNAAAYGGNAARMAEFDGYGITSGYGTTTFDKDTKTATYELDPRLAAQQGSYYDLSSEVLNNLNVNPDEYASQLFNRRQGLLEPTREAERTRLRQNALNSGRIGLGLSGAAVGAGAGTGYLNPEQYNLNTAYAIADATASAQAYEDARKAIAQDVALGTGLFTSGMNIDKALLDQLALGADIGNMASQAGGRGASLYADAMKESNQYGLDRDLGAANLLERAARSVGTKDSGSIWTDDWIDPPGGGRA